VLVLVLVSFAACAAAVPNGYAWGCLNISQGLPFCNAQLPLESRLDDLVGRLSLSEMAGLLGPDTKTGVGACNFMDAGVVRLGIPPYMHLVETNTAVASTCLGPMKCATEFAGPTGLAASFNRSMWLAKGDVISTEMRAFNNLNWYRATGDAPKSLIGLTGFGPNINIVRDPRFGRNSELPSEDPLLSGQYAAHYVRGCQQGRDGNSTYLRMVSGLKHYDAYSVEDGRPYRSFNISHFDLWDTYLPQYRIGFAAGARATMCSYASINGVPSCANDYILNQVLRDTWGHDYVVVGTDCGAIDNMINANHYAKSPLDAVQKSFNAGADMELGDTYYSPTQYGGSGLLEQAVQQGLVTTDRVKTSVRRVLQNRFLLGQFDPLAQQPLTRIGAEAVNSSAHQAINLDATLQSIVLLKNQGVLPLSAGRKLAVLGPHSISTRDLIEDYAGDQRCSDGSDNCIPTIGAMLTAANGPQFTTVVPGIAMDSRDRSGIPAALAAARLADAVVLCLGIGHTQEHEGMDRTLITLPGLQEEFALQVFALGKPVVLVLVNGGVVAIDNLINPADAIVEAFYPSMRGGEALASLLFGQTNRWGKLPVTMYPAAYTSQVSMYNFDMSLAPGRTYRYYTGPVLFPFGFGMSYTTFDMNCDPTPSEDTYQCQLRNTGNVDGDEVIMVYHRVGDDISKKVTHPVPLRRLVDFERAFVARGGSSSVYFNFSFEYLVLTDDSGQEVVYPGTHYLDFSRGVGPVQTITIQFDRYVVVRTNAL